MGVRVCVRACELPRLQVCCGIQNRFWGFESDFLAVPFLTCHFFCCCLSPSGCWKQPLPFLLSFLKSVSLRPLPTCLLSQWPWPPVCLLIPDLSGTCTFTFVSKCDWVVDFYNLYRWECWVDMSDQMKGLLPLPTTVHWLHSPHPGCICDFFLNFVFLYFALDPGGAGAV